MAGSMLDLLVALVLGLSGVSDGVASTPTPIAEAFGVTLGEAAPVLALAETDAQGSRCERRVAPQLHRCRLDSAAIPAPFEDAVALVDDEFVVRAVEARSARLTRALCAVHRRQVLDALVRRHGQYLRVAFDSWGFTGALWEQELGHEFGLRGLTLSDCRRESDGEQFRFEIAYGASR